MPRIEPLILAFDTETDGLDPYHATLPHFVTTCNSQRRQVFYEWDVDPYTRIPAIPVEDLYEIYDMIHSCDQLVMQNVKYDVQVMDNLIRKGMTGKIKDWNWPWEKIHDTQILSHMIASCQMRNLTTQAQIHLGINLLPFEKEVQAATNKARRLVDRKAFVEKYGIWFKTKEGQPGMPSAGDKDWKGDMFFLRALVRLAPEFLPDWPIPYWARDRYEEGKTEWKAASTKRVKVGGKFVKIVTEGDDPAEHPWNYLERDYALPDSESTLLLYQKQREKIAAKKLEAIYEESRKKVKQAYRLERNGVTYDKGRLQELTEQYTREAAVCVKRCKNLASQEYPIDTLPVSGTSNALRDAVFKGLELEPVAVSKKTGQPSLDKNVIEYWLLTLDPKTRQHRFIESLFHYRKRATALNYMRGYERYALEMCDKAGIPFWILHPSLNPTGTNTLRWSSSHPNEQNISKKEGFNLRYAFGPRKGRCWASLDYNNIELRIPAYESGEEIMIEIFEKANEPPFFGSYHLMNASIIFPDEFWPLADIEGAFKDKYKALYSRVKNFGFAVSYGAVLDSKGWGTADKAAGKRGAHKMVASRLKKHSLLNDKYIRMANKTGYVETIPDVEIDPYKGYPVECSRTSYGRISPTIPLNYHVQSTCMWVISRAMSKVQDYLDALNENLPEEDWWYMVMQVHDEIVLDFPKKGNWRAILQDIMRIMEGCGNNISIPLTVGCEVHNNNWSKFEETVTLTTSA